MVAVEHDHPRARPEDRGLEPPHRLVEPVEAHQAHERRRLAAGDDEPVEPVELLRLAHLDGVGAEPPQHRRVLAEVPLDGEDAAAGARAHGPTSRVTSSSGRFEQRGGRDPDHRVAEPRGDVGEDLRVLEVRRRLDDRLRAPLGIARLEDARADEDAVRAELHAERGVRGRRDPAGRERDDRQPAVLGDPLDELVRGAELLRLGVELLVAQRLQPPDAAEDGAHVRDRVDDVAGPRLALRADHRRALGDPPQRLAEVGAAADERDVEPPLVDVVLEVGGREHLGLVDVVDLEGLEDLRLDEVPDPALGHHRDRHGLLDLADLLRVGHARDAALDADVGGHALERHHGDGARVLGDPRVLGVDDVHDHPALEHLGEAGLDPHRAQLEHRGQSTTETAATAAQRPRFRVPAVADPLLRIATC